MGKYNVAMDRLKIPKRIAALPVDERGYPVPRFVRWIDGKPDFRVIDNPFFMRALKQKLCWLCGEPLGKYMAFVIGPMCSINRASSEPPSHYECAQFAVRACPFMVNPQRPRDERGLPEGKEVAGIMIARNPGVSLIWVTRDYEPIRLPNGVMFRIGDPVKTEWFARGRVATHDEIMESINTGLPALQEMAEREGPEAIKELQAYIERGLALVPTA